MNRRRPAFWHAWLGVAAWTTVVLLLSSDAFGAEGTSRILLPLLRALLPGASEETLTILHAAVRKTAHPTEYAVLGALAFRAFALGAARPRAPLGARAALLGLAYAGLVAVADETHQSFSPARTASTRDVVLDAAGAAVGIAIAAYAARLREGRASALEETAPGRRSSRLGR